MRMGTIKYIQQPINLKVVKCELNISPPRASNTTSVRKGKEVKIPEVKYRRRESFVPSPPPIKSSSRKRDVLELVEELLEELYSDHPDWNCSTGDDYTQRSVSAASIASQSTSKDFADSIERSYLESLDIGDLQEQRMLWNGRLKENGDRLARCVRTRDRLRRQQKRLCAALTVLLRHITGESSARFGVRPSGGASGAGGGAGEGEGGYAEWLHAMRLVARLPAGVPQHFRKKLWLTLADRHLAARGVDWPSAERACFRGTAQPDDTELGAQILKDLHRTGCSLFCGAEGRENQAMLRRVLLAYARWNKEVGYCQGFNMLAAIILEVMDKSESDSLKVMIYLVEAVLPEGYFADDLRGLSADMAAFRDLLRLRLPRLAHHMDQLQRASDAGGGVEPPLPDVFTMQWFLTLYATWLPRESLLRIWDLVLLDGNEVLLLTALAIWDLLQERILSARTADEYYSCMGGGVSAVWEAGDALVARVVALGSVPELPRLRSLHRYRVAPPAPPTQAPLYQPPLHSAMQTMTKKGLRLFYSEDEGDSSDDGNKLALATIIPRRDDRLAAGDRLSLDIGALKRQYARLRERQRQAHVILAAACARHAAVGVPTSPTSLTVNNLLLGKSAIVSSRGRRLGPPPGSVPPTRQTDVKIKSEHNRGKRNDTICWKEEKNLKSLSRRNSVKWKDIKREKAAERARKASIDLDETGDGIIVSESEANEMTANVRSRSSSESSSYSSHSSASSTDTSLCDENERISDYESDLPVDEHKERSNLETSANKTKIDNVPVDERTATISDFIHSAAGEPLRAYIDAFQTKTNQAVDSDYSRAYEYKSQNTINDTSFRLQINQSDTDELETKKNELLLRLSQKRNNDISKDLEHIESTSKPFSPTNFPELSPVDISPCNFGYDVLNLGSDFKSPLVPKPIEANIRPPDIIDSLTMYPNFIPDIDLSEKSISDIESPPRSPGAESIVISEDEPPIPLKIDKYFEHSPDFFGARITITNTDNSDIHSRRPTKRQSRVPKKPDSLTLQGSYKEKSLTKNEGDRASSLPHSTSNNFEIERSPVEVMVEYENEEKGHLKTQLSPQLLKLMSPIEYDKQISPNDFVIFSGRKNSERALQIIQENSKILSRILTKQNISETSKTGSKASCETKKIHNDIEKFSGTPKEKCLDNRLMDSPFLKESTSDSLIGYCKRIGANESSTERNEFIRIRPISLDDPFSLESRNFYNVKGDDAHVQMRKSPNSERLENKTDIYGWENKGFMAKCHLKRTEHDLDLQTENKSNFSNTSDHYTADLKQPFSSEWINQEYMSEECKSSITLPSSETKETPPYEKKIPSEDYSYAFSSKYNDFVLTKASDICSKTVDRGPKVCENLSKTDSSQISDFAHVVTSSISFTYEPSVDDDFVTGAKSNSSDTLCQITSLDQVSTPISPKIFPTRETPTLSKESLEKYDKTKYESDDTCSAITSLIESDTLSSISYPRSPSTGSYHPFPARPAIRMPKELGIRLGMYPRDSLNSPSK